MPADFVPEFTQLGPKGMIIARGWRSVFEKCIKAGAVTAYDVERTFNVSLARIGKDVMCPTCRKHNLKIKGEGASGLCSRHQYAQAQVAYQERMNNNESYL
jgi:hypothetical protein